VQLKRGPSRQASIESPSNGSNEALARSAQKKYVEKGKGFAQGRKRNYIDLTTAHHLNHLGMIALNLMPKTKS